jgi:outer membrane protein assembly factor BamB
MRLCLPAAITLLLVSIPTAQAKITSVVTLEQLVNDQSLIFTATVTEFLPDKPGMVIIPTEKLRGEFPFDRVPVNLTGDDEAKKEKQLPIVLERLEKDLPLVIFANRRGATINAVAYTNGTWLRLSGQVEKDGDKEVTRWQFRHCETYFRRTYKGTTDELLKAIRGGLKGEKLPPYNEKEEPGYGPPLKKKEGRPEKEPLATGSTLQTRLPLGVIQIPFLGLIAALAALFPAVFGGAALLMRRWVVALSIASFISILSVLVLYFPNWINWTGLKSVSSLWFTAAALAGLGALWAGYRYRRATREGRGDEYQPRYLDRVVLSLILILGLGGLTYAVVNKADLADSPWLELVLFLVPTVACLYLVLAHWLRTRAQPAPVAISAETAGLWAGCLACAVAGATLMTGARGPAMVSASGSGVVKLDERPVWVFEPKEKGEIVSTPCVTNERVFVAVHHRQGFDQYGRVYALDPQTGAVQWQFDDNDALKPLFSSPVFAEGRLYFGEGYHTDQDSKLYCLDATTGQKLWAFATTSHTESSPAVADGKVVFGAGDDGLYCLDAVLGEKLWQFPAGGGLHVDSNPLIHDGRVYAGSGTSKRSQTTRILCLDLQSGREVWGEKIEYAAWGSPAAAGNHVYFATGNGTFSEDRAPIAGLVLCRDAATGKPIWERALANSLVGKPAVDRYQVYVGCKDGNIYALDRQSGEVVWNTGLQGPVLAAPAVDVNPQVRTGEVLYAVGSTGILEALAPADGSPYWAVSLRNLVEAAHARAVSTPVVVREPGDGNRARRVYVGLGFGPSPAATPTARLYCFRDSSE